MLDEEVFDYYAPYIRDFIYRNNWTELREVQIEAGKAIFGTDDNVLLTSGTASGKTEAVFFPMLSQFEEDPPASVAVIYLAPLKSLINDQFFRLDLLLEEASVPVYHWHGDVATSHKTKMLKEPKGVLQITPESLESMLINRSNDLPRIFGDLRYVVIDEIHTLPMSDRGNQVICQLERLQHIIQKSPRRIGLSATVGDPELMAEWLSQGSGKSCQIIQITTAKPKWRIGINHFFVQPEGVEPAETITKSGRNVNEDMIETMPNLREEAVFDEETGEETVEEVPVIDESYEFVYDSVKDKKAIVFANSREEVEYCTATLRQIANLKHEDDIFYIHHGFISASIREQTESALKDEEKKAVACATVTMELGIDIGELERIVQLGAPNTVANFLQRLGRSGRRGGHSEMILSVREETPLTNTSLPHQIPWELLKSIAIIQVYLEDKFIEPPAIKKMPMSLLFHQIMSVLAAHGEMSAKDLADRMLNIQPFQYVTKDQFKLLLLHMLQNEHLQFTEEKNIIIGLNGEKILNSYKFYAVFVDNDDYKVMQEAQEIGTITETPPVGDRFALAGHSWEVVDLDLPRKIIYVKQIEGKLEVAWPGEAGEVHTKILEKMREILLVDREYPYLFPNAKRRLEEAREIARKTNMLQHPVVSMGGNKWALFPWLGTRSFRTLRRFIKSKCSGRFKLSDVDFEGCYYMEFKMERGTDYELLQYINDYIERNGMELPSLVGEKEDFAFQKYDKYVPQPLLRDGFIFDALREDEATKRMREFIEMY